MSGNPKLDRLAQKYIHLIDDNGELTLSERLDPKDLADDNFFKENFPTRILRPY